jgi:hypothetical protein
MQQVRVRKQAEPSKQQLLCNKSGLESRQHQLVKPTAVMQQVRVRKQAAPIGLIKEFDKEKTTSHVF